MHPISKAEWETIWRDLREAGKKMSLNQYAVHCNKVKKSWADKFGNWRFDNGRYVVHVEEALGRGFSFPGDVSLEDIRYDAPAFPMVRAALEKIKEG